MKYGKGILINDLDSEHFVNGKGIKNDFFFVIVIDVEIFSTRTSKTLLQFIILNAVERMYVFSYLCLRKAKFSNSREFEDVRCLRILFVLQKRDFDHPFYFYLKYFYLFI